MLYKILKFFGPGSGKEWDDYQSWIDRDQLESFDSIDSMLRDECFEPKTEEDWRNCVNEDFKLNFINNLEYAVKVQCQNPGSEIVGVDIEITEGYTAESGFCGFDILDEWFAVSLITNWRKDELVFDSIRFESNGLIGNVKEALATRDMLRTKYLDDPHAKNCKVLAVYRVAA